MKTKILRNIFLSGGVLFASARVVAAAMTSILLLGILAPGAPGGTTDRALNFSNMPLLQPQPTIITFDAPGAGTGPGQGTIAFAINPAGTISGRYADAGGAIHAILRTADGAIITFDAPGAGTGPRQGTRPFSINPAGASAGYYSDASGVFHGFLRTPDGAITTFDVPGAGTGPGQGTFAGNINPPEAIAGRYVDASDVAHGFLRAPDGAITTFDAPDAGTGPGQGTFVFTGYCLNPAGAIAAASLDASNVYHGVLRAPDGTMTTFDPPGAGTGPFQGTLPLGINQAGTIEGDYVDASDVNHGFLRTSDGTITTFDVPGAGTGPFQGTSAQGINAAGRSRESTWTRATSITALCVLRTAPLPHSMFPARAQALGKVLSLFPTIRSMRSPDTILTRTV
jgi:hypothetical protein